MRSDLSKNNLDACSDCSRRFSRTFALSFVPLKRLAKLVHRVTVVELRDVAAAAALSGRFTRASASPFVSSPRASRVLVSAFLPAGMARPFFFPEVCGKPWTWPVHRRLSSCSDSNVGAGTSACCCVTSPVATACFRRSALEILSGATCPPPTWASRASVSSESV